MLPAARIGDSTVHGGTIVTGFPTVLIGGRPASRVTDNHVCPMVTGTVPHVGGPIILGSFTVLTGNMAQARVSDTAVCTGPPDLILMGQPNVLVGMAGGAGLGGLAAGAAMAGGAPAAPTYPRSVTRPDGTTVTEYNEYITIEGSPEYQATVAHDLDQFLSTKTGKEWAKRYEKTGRKTTIQPIPSGKNHANAYARAASKGAYLKSEKTPGAGSDTTVMYNPSLHAEYKAEDGSTQTLEPSDVLAHELIHALHNAEGTNRRHLKDPKDKSDNQEEAQTIGVHGFEKEPISERSLMKEKGKPVRPNHNAVTSLTYRNEAGNWQNIRRGPKGKWIRSKAKAPPGAGWRPSR